MQFLKSMNTRSYILFFSESTNDNMCKKTPMAGFLAICITHRKIPFSERFLFSHDEFARNVDCQKQSNFESD